MTFRAPPNSLGGTVHHVNPQTINRIKLDTAQLDWRPAHEVWPGYVLGGLDQSSDPSGAGVFLKVLRRPEDGGGCWCALLRFSPPAGQAIRVTATAASDEEVLILSDSAGTRPGTFTCNPKDLRHGNTFVADTVAFVHYHGDPDDVLRAELVPAGDAGR